jgi:hypothetical protein
MTFTAERCASRLKSDTDRLNKTSFSPRAKFMKRPGVILTEESEVEMLTFTSETVAKGKWS